MVAVDKNGDGKLDLVTVDFEVGRILIQHLNTQPSPLRSHSNERRPQSCDAAPRGFLGLGPRYRAYRTRFPPLRTQLWPVIILDRSRVTGMCSEFRVYEAN